MKFRRPIPALSSKTITAFATAVLLLAVQLAGVAHFHTFNSSRQTLQTLSAADEACSLCAVTLHSPAASAPVQAPFAPALSSKSTLPTVLVGFSRIFSDDHFGRAPPASL